MLASSNILQGKVGSTFIITKNTLISSFFSLYCQYIINMTHLTDSIMIINATNPNVLYASSDIQRITGRWGKCLTVVLILQEHKQWPDKTKTMWGDTSNEKYSKKWHLPLTPEKSNITNPPLQCCFKTFLLGYSDVETYCKEQQALSLQNVTSGLPYWVHLTVYTQAWGDPSQTTWPDADKCR